MLVVPIEMVAYSLVGIALGLAQLQIAFNVSGERLK
jgi:hypothetical protein